MKNVYIGLLLIITFGASLALADDFVPEGEDDLSISANVFTLDADNTGGDIDLQFGEVLGEYLRWDAANTRFSVSGDLDLASSQLINARIENLNGAPTCNGAASGRVYFDTGSATGFICNASGWVPMATNAGAPYINVSVDLFMSPGTTQTLTITGANFLPTSVVSFPGFPGTINTTTVLGPTQIEVNVTTTAAQATYDIVINNSGLTNTTWPGNGVGAFEVAAVTGTGVAGTYTENFEAGLGSWTDSGLDQPWIRDNGGTPSNGTGPTVGAGGSAFYVFTETSGNGTGYPDMEFGLETTDFATAQSVAFDYHMVGGSIGTLELQTRYLGVWTTRFSLTGQQQAAQGDAYLNQSVDLSSFQVEAIRFLYTSTTNWDADAALDNIVIISTWNI